MKIYLVVHAGNNVHSSVQGYIEVVLKANQQKTIAISGLDKANNGLVAVVLPEGIEVDNLTVSKQ